MYAFNAVRLRQLMTEQHWSVAALARHLNARVTTVSGWVNGRHQPALGNAERLADVLNCPVSELWQEVQTTTPGVTGAVPLTQDQALVLSVAVALAAADPQALATDWRRRLTPGEQHALMQRLILSPQWAWAWAKLRKLAQPSHPLAGYTVQVKLQGPPSPRKERH
jgi:transcriptional regulator with XRE-family HTH domain